MPNLPAPSCAASSDVLAAEQVDVPATTACPCTDMATTATCSYCGVVTADFCVDGDEVVSCRDVAACEARQSGLQVAERHALDDVLEAALDEWQASPVDQRTEGSVIRATLADPQHRWLVTAWLQEAGLS